MSHRDENANPAETLLLAAGPAATGAACKALAAGALVAFPTETVYGLGADATRDDAVAGIYAAKQRPSFNPLISHVGDLAAAECEGVFNGDALKLANALWPGPLTLVVPASPTCSVSLLARAGLDTLALRVPAHPVALEILRAFGRPVAAPSANPSGRVSPTSAQHVVSELGHRCNLIIDGGDCPVGLESTIVDCSRAEPVLLRPGGVAREEIERVLGRPLAMPMAGGAVTAPGMLASHYAPNVSVRLNAVRIQAGEAVLDFAGQLGAEAPRARLYIDLSARGDLREAAANLFAMLRKLDASGAQGIAVARLPSDGLGEAINDRLTRAAAPRE